MKPDPARRGPPGPADAGTLPPSPPDSPEQWESEVAIAAPLYDIIICSALLILGGWFVYGALQMQQTTAVFDPGTFPLIAGGLLVLLSGIQIVLTLAGKGSPGSVVFQRPLWLAIGMVLVMAFPFAVDAFGYYIVALIWVPVFGWVAGVRHLLSLLATTAIVLLLAKGVFEMLLGTPLP